MGKGHVIVDNRCVAAGAGAVAVVGAVGAAADRHLGAEGFESGTRRLPEEARRDTATCYGV